MAPGKQRNDQEHGLSGSQQLPPYRDEESDDDATIAPPPEADSRLDSTRSSTTEFGGLRLGGAADDTWPKKLVHRIPPGLKKAWAATVKWVQGPTPPRIFSITPFFPTVQHLPLRLLDRYAPKRIHRFWLLMVFYSCWILSFFLFLRASSFSAEIPGYGKPYVLSCAARYWSDANGCGLNGDLCRPFANSTLAFRCPADCQKTHLLNPHAVGDQEVIYKPLVVGGPAKEQTGFEDAIVDNAVYRGDSFICASAMHSGFLKKSEGGCGVLTLTGEQLSFAPSDRNGFASTGFDSYFPHSFGFLKGTKAQCKDLRWPTLALSVFFTTVLALFTTDPGVFFWSAFVGLYFHCALVSDPPSMSNYYGLISQALSGFLPACFCAWVTYKYTVKRSLTNLTAQFEKAILWLGPAWVGTLNNYTFDRIPIERLTPHDLARPGAIPALITIVLVILVIALGQAWSFRIEGRMPRYLAIYGLMVLALLVGLAAPGLNLRIHHYILGLLFLPGTSFQNRPSLVYQGLLLGFFINGVARWGFASILETPASLLEGLQRETLLPVATVLATHAKNITFDLGSLPMFDKNANINYDGISILVNDVERFRGYSDDRSHWTRGERPESNFTWTWTRHEPQRGSDSNDAPTEDQQHSLGPTILPEYFRFGYMSGSSNAEFTKAGVWNADGKWTPMEPGPS